VPRAKTIAFHYVAAPREGLQVIIPNWVAPVIGTTHPRFNGSAPREALQLIIPNCAAPVTGTIYGFHEPRP